MHGRKNIKSLRNVAEDSRRWVYTLWGEWCSSFRMVVILSSLESNSISTEDEGITIFRNVGNHTTVLLRIQVLGRVVSGVSGDRNTFSVKQ